MLNPNSPLLDKWQTLSQREQYLVLIMSAFLLIAMLFALIWKPVMSMKENAQMDFERAQQQWHWLNQQVPQWKSLQASSTSQKGVTNQNQMMSLLQKNARQFNLQGAMTSLSQTAKGAKAIFKEVDATRAMRWIAQNETEGLLLTNARIQPIRSGVIQMSTEWEFVK
jgi:type II secretory pathway component PulM